MPRKTQRPTILICSRNPPGADNGPLKCRALRSCGISAGAIGTEPLLGVTIGPLRMPPAKLVNAMSRPTSYRRGSHRGRLRAAFSTAQSRDRPGQTYRPRGRRTCSRRCLPPGNQCRNTLNKGQEAAAARPSSVESRCLPGMFRADGWRERNLVGAARRSRPVHRGRRSAPAAGALPPHKWTADRAQ